MIARIVLCEDELIEIDNTLVPCRVYLVSIAGGKQVQYVEADGTIIKREKLSRSQYRFQVDPDKYKK